MKFMKRNCETCKYGKYTSRKDDLEENVMHNYYVCNNRAICESYDLWEKRVETENTKTKYVRIQFSNGKFKTIKGCKDLSFDEAFNRSCVRVHCTDGRIYIFNWNLIQEFKLWEEEPNPKDPDSPLYFATIGNPVEMLVDDKWIKGKIVEGYFSNLGIIAIETETGERFFCDQERKDLVRPYKEEDEKHKRSRKKVSTKASGDKGDRPGDPSPDGTEESSDRSDVGEGS